LEINDVKDSLKVFNGLIRSSLFKVNESALQIGFVNFLKKPILREDLGLQAGCIQVSLKEGLLLLFFFHRLMV
jgi:hypothetical protein